MLDSIKQFSLNGSKIIIVALNLILFYIIMRKLLFKRITQFMENRTKTIKDSIENAEKVKAEAFDLKRQYEDRIKTAGGEAEKILETARIKAEKEYDRIVGQAKKDSESILTHAREEIEHERERMFKEVRSQIAGIALAAASKVIEANMDTESNRVLVDRFIDEAGAA